MQTARGEEQKGREDGASCRDNYLQGLEALQEELGFVLLAFLLGIWLHQSGRQFAVALLLQFLNFLGKFVLTKRNQNTVRGAKGGRVWQVITQADGRRVFKVKLRQTVENRRKGRWKERNKKTGRRSNVQMEQQLPQQSFRASHKP